MRVAQLLTVVLDALDRDIKLDPGTSNGDVLRGIAMALAIRAAMIEAPKEQTDAPVRDLVAVACPRQDRLWLRALPVRMFDQLKGIAMTRSIDFWRRSGRYVDNSVISNKVRGQLMGDKDLNIFQVLVQFNFMRFAIFTSSIV